MPNAHSAYRPVPEVELLGSRRINLEDAIRGLEEAVASSEGSAGADLGAATPGSSSISFHQIPRVLDSLTSEWRAASAGDRSDDCFSEVRGRLIMHMHPCFLGDKLMQGMREAAGQLLMRHSTVLKHVPLGFKELKPSNSHAAIVGESAYVHFLIDFRCIGFQPRQNMKLIGRLAQVQTAVGVNCTIFNNFNFFVHKSDLPRDAWFDGEEGTWMLQAEKKLIKERHSMSLPLMITRTTREDSAFLPVNFRGVLARNMPPPNTFRLVYVNPEHATLAVSRLNGSELGGGVIGVAVDPGNAKNELVITGVPITIDWKDLKDHFKQIGPVGFCKFNAADEEQDPDGRPVDIKPPKPAKRRKEEREPDGEPAGSKPAKPSKRRKEDGAAGGATASGSASSASKQKPGGSA